MIEQTVGGDGSQSTASDGAGGSTQEHIDKMVARADGTTTPETPPETPPESTEGESLLAGKYKTTEDLEKAYVELQKKFSSGEGRGEPPATPESTEGEPPANTNLPERTEGEGEGESEGEGEPSGQIDFEKYSRSFAENGELSDGDYSELEAKGIPRGVVDAYIQGVQAQGAKRAADVAEAVGGTERFEAIRQWAASDLSEADYNAVNAQITNAKTTEEVALVYETLATRYDKANPTATEPSLVTGKTPAQTPGVGFGNRKEMTDAVNDPRYKTDPKYRADVERKIGASPFL